MDDIYQVYRISVSSIQLTHDTNNLIKINEHETAMAHISQKANNELTNGFNMNVCSKDTHDKDIHPL